MRAFQEDDTGVRVGDRVFYILSKKRPKYHSGTITRIIGGDKAGGGYHYGYEIDGIYYFSKSDKTRLGKPVFD